jgi:hypothetical protein
MREENGRNAGGKVSGNSSDRKTRGRRGGRKGEGRLRLGSGIRTGKKLRRRRERRSRGMERPRRGCCNQCGEDDDGFEGEGEEEGEGMEEEDGGDVAVGSGMMPSAPVAILRPVPAANSLARFFV